MAVEHNQPHEWSLSDGRCVHCGDYNPGVWMRERDQGSGRPGDDEGSDPAHHGKGCGRGLL